MKPTFVTIDGPAASGKSTTSRRLAERLGALYLDSGAMYRAATLAAIQQLADWNDTASLGRLAESLDIRFEGAPTAQKVFVDGRDVTEAIRDVNVTRQIHAIAAAPEVRRAMRAKQQQVAAARPVVVAEGRDMGTVVFPGALCKIYLDASVDERARRRHAEESARGVAIDFETVRRDIVERDRSDIERADSPLRQPDDAIVFDTTGLTFEESVEGLVELVQSKLAEAAPADGARRDHVV